MRTGSVESYTRFGLVSRECPDEVPSPSVLFSVLIIIVVVFVIIFIPFVMHRPLANLLDLDLRHSLQFGIRDHFLTEEEGIVGCRLIIGSFADGALLVSGVADDAKEILTSIAPLKSRLGPPGASTT
jgi:hypothetical protein